MAAPVTHIVLANKVYDQIFPDISKAEFFMGTNLPDIRYIGAVDRDSTHFDRLATSQLRDTNPFMTGVKFHSIVDEVREDYVLKNDLYSKMPQSKYAMTALKLLEDELLYEKVLNWEEFTNSLETIPYDQIEIDIEKEYIDLWYSFIKKYLTTRPSAETRKVFIKNLNRPEGEEPAVNSLIEELKSNFHVVRYIEDLYRNFDNLLP